MMLDAGLREAFEIGSVISIWYTNRVNALRLQHSLEIEVPGIIDQHGIAGPQKKTANDVNRACGRVREQHAAGIRRNSALVQASCQLVAQWEVALRRAISRKVGLLLAHDAAKDAAQHIAGQPFVG